MRECGGIPLTLEVGGFRVEGMNLFDMFSEALVIWETSGGTVLYANEAARNLYGFSGGEITGLPLEEIFPGWEGVLPKDSFSLLTATHRKKNGIFFSVQATCRALCPEAADVMMMAVSDFSKENLAHNSVSLAAAIQRGFLPGDLGENDRVEVRGIYRPKFLISGDMYGYRWDEGQGILSGYLFDVMGHGVPAALQTSAIMVLFRQAFEEDERAGTSLQEKLRWVNSMAESRILLDSFAAAVCFRLNLPEKRIYYCSAGINGFFHGKKNGLEKVSSPGSLLGLPGETVFGFGSLPVEQGDYFLFLSDGFPDHPLQTDNGRPDFSEACDQLFQAGYMGAGRDDQSALCVLVRQA